MSTPVDNGWSAFSKKALDRQAIIDNAAAEAIQQIEFGVVKAGGGKLTKPSSSSVSQKK
jgi:hypothetical protein